MGLKTIIKLTGWALVIYMFIFQPIISKYIYIGAEALLVLFLYIKRPKAFAENVRLFKKEYVFASLICGYSLLMDVSNMEVVYLDRFLASFFQGYLVSFLLVYCISKSRFLQENLSKCIVLVCFIACSITIAAVLIPSFGQFCINYATLDSKERLQELYVDGGYMQYRSFGLSESLNFTYAYVLSVIGAYLLSSKFKIYIPFLLLMIFVTIIFNARIAFVPLLIALFYLIFLKKKNLKVFLSLIITSGVILLLAIWGMGAFPELNNEWGLSFFLEISDLLSGKDEGTLGTLTGSMWVIPDDFFSLFFGTGENLFISAKQNSDVGYVLQLNYGGIILLGTILVYFIYISRRIYNKLSIRHWFVLMFVVSVFVLNFKGFYLSAIPGSRFLTFLYVYYIYASRKGVKELDPGIPLVCA